MRFGPCMRCSRGCLISFKRLSALGALHLRNLAMRCCHKHRRKTTPPAGPFAWFRGVVARNRVPAKGPRNHGTRRERATRRGSVGYRALTSKPCTADQRYRFSPLTCLALSITRATFALRFGCSFRHRSKSFCASASLKRKRSTSPRWK